MVVRDKGDLYYYWGDTGLYIYGSVGLHFTIGVKSDHTVKSGSPCAWTQFCLATHASHLVRIQVMHYAKWNFVHNSLQMKSVAA